MNYKDNLPDQIADLLVDRFWHSHKVLSAGPPTVKAFCVVADVSRTPDGNLAFGSPLTHVAMTGGVIPSLIFAIVLADVLTPRVRLKLTGQTDDGSFVDVTVEKEHPCQPNNNFLGAIPLPNMEGMGEGPTVVRLIVNGIECAECNFDVKSLE